MKKFREGFLHSNRGSSLVIVLAIFALFMVLSANLMLAAKATGNGLSDEYDSDRVNLYVNSVYKVINHSILFDDLPGLVSVNATKDVPSLVEFSGFDEDVTGEAYKEKSVLYLKLYITFEEKTYTVTARYQVSGASVTSLGCDGIVSEN